MSCADLFANDFGYYPRTMIRFCKISYDDMNMIPGEVAKLGWNVVWGPAEAVSEFGISYSRMFVAHRPDPDEYTVVIRGTNMYSWESWTQEDFDVGVLEPFDQLAPHAPPTALIACGTRTGMQDLIKLTDPKTGKGVVDYLKGADPTYLYVTGHSLGGTLTPTMFAYLNDVLYGGGYVHNMAPFSFAGLTAGDGGFNTYYNGLFNPEFPWRFHNTLDIAPFMWWSPSDVRNIYAPHGLNWGWPEDDLLEDLFKKAAGKGYAQPKGDQVLQGVFDTSIVDEYLWVAQAMHQHHTTTYQPLIDKIYPG